MGKSAAMPYGALIERGKIKAAAEGGYIVASFDREGIETPPIKPINEAEYAVGNEVYFFLFRDGTGRIICSL